MLRKRMPLQICIVDRNASLLGNRCYNINAFSRIYQVSEGGFPVASP